MIALALVALDSFAYNKEMFWTPKQLQEPSNLILEDIRSLYQRFTVVIQFLLTFLASSSFLS